MAVHLDHPPLRILIIKPSAIGDVVHALPVLASLRKKFSRAHIAWLVTPQCAGLLERHPLLDEVILFDRRKLGAAWWKPEGVAGLWQLMRDLRSRRFDLVLELQGLFRSGWLARVTGAPVRVGLRSAREFAGIFYTDRIHDSRFEQHAVDRYRAMAADLGCDVSQPEFPFAVDEADRRWVDERISPATRYAVLIPGSNWVTKRWPIENFAAIVAPLRERFGLESVVAGGAGDKSLAMAIRGALDLTGETSLRQSVALLERADLVIANDSGPMHIAAALDRPLVALYGPTDPNLTGPYGREDSVVRIDIPCSPCLSRKCSHQSCLRWLTIEQVLARAEQQLSRARSTRDELRFSGTVTVP
jgi:lipopolysaccharide heptosyltransferase I